MSVQYLDARTLERDWKCTELHAVTYREELDAKTGECAELEAARAEVAAELAEAQSSIAELAAGKQALESSLAASKASLQACEDKLVSAEVNTSPKSPTHAKQCL